MSNFFQERELKADINISTSGDNIIIGPGVGQMPAAWENGAEYLAIDYLVIYPAASVTLQLKDGATAYGGSFPLAAQQAFVLENAPHFEDGVIKLSPNSNFVINLGTSVAVTGFVRYRRMMSN